jgi:hypothetical protein
MVLKNKQLLLHDYLGLKDIFKPNWRTHKEYQTSQMDYHNGDPNVNVLCLGFRPITIWMAHLSVEG